MSKIKIKNFGPIKEGYQEDGGFMDIKKVTMFIGNQGSGKSTVAKLISTLTWIEKAFNRGDFSESWSFHDFKEQFEYQNLDGYFRDDTIIDYEGERYSISYNMFKNQWPLFEKKSEKGYVVPKIMYVPSERNFLSVIKDANGVRGLPEPLFEFAEELRKSQEFIGSKGIQLPVNDVYYKYDSNSEIGIIYNQEYSVDMLAASSGFQSLVPLFLVSNNLSDLILKADSDLNADTVSVNQKLKINKQIAEIMLSKSLTDIEKLSEVDTVKSKFISKAFINIVEEPEQNLYPISQRRMLNSLVEFNNINKGNKLIITTHSPYLINYLTHSVKASIVLEKIKSSKQPNELSEKLNNVVPLHSTVSSDDWVVYELNEGDGTIIKLKDYNGLPSDANYLNERMAEGNEIFGKLLDIEDLCQ